MRIRVQGSGFRVRIRVQGSGFRVRPPKCHLIELNLMVLNSGH